MWGALIGFIVTSTVVALQLPQQVTAQDVLAFVTEVKGKAQIVRASGGVAVGAVGGRPRVAWRPISNAPIRE